MNGHSFPFFSPKNTPSSYISTIPFPDPARCRIAVASRFVVFISDSILIAHRRPDFVGPSDPPVKSTAEYTSANCPWPRSLCESILNRPCPCPPCPPDDGNTSFLFNNMSSSGSSTLSSIASSRCACVCVRVCVDYVFYILCVSNETRKNGGQLEVQFSPIWSHF